ncbi:hypothetical protein P43SY_001205 [Pythium insidiosum]|uniref:Sodium-dependent phosphate transporter n=1 Tax=Pythium insidiosum TaxID=114742 RepID=A0AAD5M5D8_PYTIN|nr:hypothetical protein P43SY_001205 [Pythium insidiosum]
MSEQLQSVDVGNGPDAPSSPRVNSAPTKYLLQGEETSNDVELSEKTRAEKVWGYFQYLTLSLAALYFFMVAIKLIGDGFTLALGCNAKGAFDFADNPVAGVMIGTVATAVLHSSGTVTSIVVALVGSGGMTIRQGVYVIMGANVGTCVTCIMVAFGQVGERAQFQRAMAAATVHDMYNIWSVIVLFPVEVLFAPLERLSVAMSNAKANKGAFKSPVDAVVNPLAHKILAVDKQAIYQIATGAKVCAPGGSFVKAGVFKGSSMGDGSVGALVVCMGFAILVCALVTLVQMLGKLFLGPTKKAIAKLLDYNGYVNILVGTVITFAVHSSTVVTSTLTPMAGLGVITLEQVYPLVIGANLGTTGLVSLYFFMVAVKLIGDGLTLALGCNTHDTFNFAYRPIAGLMIGVVSTALIHSSILFPIEELFHPLEELSRVMSNAKTSQGGAFAHSDLSDQAVGVLVIAMGLIILAAALSSLIRMMARVFLGATKRVIAEALDCNGYLNILIGTALTFAVHSSTLVTSTLTPMAGLGVVTLEQVYPLVLGANLGTTATALLASLVTGKKDAVAIALVHFWFNFFGIFLFYPLAVTRKLILVPAITIARWSAAWPLVAVIFVVLCFLGIPLIFVVLIMAPRMTIDVFNVADDSTLEYPLVLLDGAVRNLSLAPPGCFLDARLDAQRGCLWPIATPSGRFKALVLLPAPGRYAISLEVAGICVRVIHVTYAPDVSSRFRVKFYYQKCADTPVDAGFDAPPGVDNSDHVAMSKIKFNALLMQTAMAEMLRHAGLPPRTFALEVDGTDGLPIVHMLQTTSFSTMEARTMHDHKLIDLVEKELVALGHNDHPHVKFKHAVILGCSTYNPMTKQPMGHTALGGGKVSVRIAVTE